MRTDVLTSHGCAWETAASVLSLGTVVLKNIVVILHRTLETDHFETGHYRFFSRPPQFTVYSLLRHRFFL